MKNILIVLILIISSLALNSKDIPPCSCVPLHYYDFDNKPYKTNQDTAVVFDTCNILHTYSTCDSIYYWLITIGNFPSESNRKRALAKYYWSVVFEYDAINIPKAPNDTILYVTWDQIDTLHPVIREGFKQLGEIYGPYKLKKDYPNHDTGYFSRMFELTFESWVPIDEVENFANNLIGYKQCEFKRWPIPGSIVSVDDMLSGYMIYPNPVSDYLYIEYPGFVASFKDKYEITSYLGSKYEVKAEFAGQDNIKLNCSGLPNGLYFIKINNQISKFIIYR